MSFNLNNSPDWRSLLGTRFEGLSELSELVSEDTGTATFRTPSPDGVSLRQLVKVFRLSASEAKTQKSIWQALIGVQHNNLLRVFAASTAEMGGEPIVYVATEATDETLATLLADRALSSEEAGGVLESIVPALKQLHRSGFVHGRVGPAEIFAVGETIKLSADCASRTGDKRIAYSGLPKLRAPEMQDENTTAAADVWCLGASLFEALTKTPFSPSRLDEVARLTAPFNRVIARCLDTRPAARPVAEEIISLYQGRVTPLAAVKAPVSTPAPPPMRAEPEPLNTGKHFAGTIPEPRRNRLLVTVLAVALLIALAIWWGKSGTPSKGPQPSSDAKTVTEQATPPAVVPAVVAPAAVAPAPVRGTPQAKSLADHAPAAQPAPIAGSSDSPTRADSPKSVNGSIWRVVLWTYRQRSNAQEKVDDLAKRFPTLQPAIFVPSEGKDLYLVVVGGEMTYKAAEEMRLTAIQQGLPRDTYTQNFNH